MKTLLFACTASLAAAPVSLLPAQSPPVPAPAPAAGGDLIKATKIKVLQRHLETAMAEKLEIQKQLLTAPADQQEALKTKAAALAKFMVSLEEELLPLTKPQSGDPPASPPSREVMLKAVNDQITRLQKRRTEKNAALRTAIVNLRQTAGTSLKQLATSSEPAVSTALLAHVRWLSTIEPEVSLSATQEMKSLAGVWKHGLAPYRQGSFTPNGLTVHPDGTPHGTWTWLDESQGLFVVDDIPSKWMNLCRIVDAETIESVVIDSAQFKYKRTAPATIMLPALPASCDIITKLKESEETLRSHAAEAWQKDAVMDLAVLGSNIDRLPETDKPEFRLTLERLRNENSNQVKIEPSSNLSGKWVFEGRTLEFKSGGIVTVNGEPKGKWMWGKARSHGTIVFTLGAGQLAAIGNFGGDSMELQIIGSPQKQAMKL